jgi:hypothetical protein
MKESDNKKPRQIRLGNKKVDRQMSSLINRLGKMQICLGNKKVDRQMSSLVNRLGKMPGMFNTTTIQKKNIVLIYNPRNHSRWQQKQKPNKITRRARKGADTVRKMADPSGTAMTEVLKHRLLATRRSSGKMPSLVNRLGKSASATRRSPGKIFSLGNRLGKSASSTRRSSGKIRRSLSCSR